jgi:hypothetical protein
LALNGLTSEFPWDVVKDLSLGHPHAHSIIFTTCSKIGFHLNSEVVVRDASPLIINLDSYMSPRWVYKAKLWDKLSCLLSEVVSFGGKEDT